MLFIIYLKIVIVEDVLKQLIYGTSFFLLIMVIVTYFRFRLNEIMGFYEIIMYNIWLNGFMKKNM